MELKKGALLQRGEYRIDSVLGQGSFGITYLATARFRGQLGDISVKVAIKEFFARDLNMRHPDGTVSEVGSGGLSGKYARDFLRESKNLSSLKHPGVINVFESFSENNTHYYVMEYLDGGNLDDYIRSKGRLGESEALGIFHQIAEALSYMHSHRMLHLDLKPKNVMRRSDGTVCLIDFGLSKQYDSNGEPESSTGIGLGTSGYAPLEQGSNDDRKTFAPSLDVYALGATLYKMLTGKTPPPASDIMNDGFPEEELRLLRISERTLGLLHRMMALRKKDRPQTVSEVMALFKVKSSSFSEKTRIDDEATVRISVHEEQCKVQTVKVQKPKKRIGVYLVWLFILFAVCYIGVLYYKYEVKAKQQAHLERLREQVVADSMANIEAENARKAQERQEGAHKEREEAESRRRETGYSNGVLKVNGIEYPMVYVAGGSFMMGSDDVDAYSGEKPVHSVALSGYYIGKYEVTQDLWKEIMGANPSYFKGPRRPVENISWGECQEFIRKLNSITGQNFKLPTEAQWEFAARGGNNSNGYKYSGSDSIDNVAWCCDESTHNVGSKSCNELGVYDMSGNVREWCSDWYASYSRNSVIDPVGPPDGFRRVNRGGCWYWGARGCCVYSRNADDPNACSHIGLRLCL